jgi:hypothetical protein
MGNSFLPTLLLNYRTCVKGIITIFYAKMTARALLKDCGSLVPTNSAFIGYGLLNPAAPDPGPASLFRPWREDWTLVGCGHKVNEIVDFVPQQAGTAIIVPLGNATEQ